MKFIINERQLRLLTEQNYTFEPSSSNLDVVDVEKYDPFGDCEKFAQIVNKLFSKFSEKSSDKQYIQTAVLGQLNRIDRISPNEFLSMVNGKSFMSSQDLDFLKRLKDKAQISNFQDYFANCDLKNNSNIDPENKSLVKDLYKDKPKNIKRGSSNCQGGMGAFETPSCKRLMQGRGLGK